MKNPYGVEPTRYMKREESEYAINCFDHYGPYFCDIEIIDLCNRENSSCIDNDGTNAYDCHPLYKSSLFVNTAGPDEVNNFTVLDYEVFSYN